MSNQLATVPPQRPSALRTMAGRLNVEPEALLKSLKETVCKGCTDSELMAFSIVANEYGLNPFIKHIYAFPAKGGGIVPVVSVDGWITMANNHPQMDGLEFTDDHEDGKLVSITCTIHRKDRARPVVVKEYLDECRRPTDPWKMAHRMLRHKSLIQCARYAFGFSGVYDEDEAADIANSGGMREVTGRVIPDANPYSEAPAAEAPAPAAQPAAKATRKAKPADSPAATDPAPETPAATPMPERRVMVEGIRGAYRTAGISQLLDAESQARAAGLLPEGKGFTALTNEEMFLVYQASGTLFTAPVAEADPGENYPMGDEGKGDQAP